MKLQSILLATTTLLAVGCSKSDGGDKDKEKEIPQLAQIDEEELAEE